MEWFSDSTSSLGRIFSSSGNSSRRESTVDKRSVPYVRRLAAQLRKNVSARQNGGALAAVDEIIQDIHELADILVYSDNRGIEDRSANELFDCFVEAKVHVVLLRLFNIAEDDSVTLALFRFFNVLFEGLQQPKNIYFLLSSNYINEIISVRFNTANEEILSYYITLLKNLSLKLNIKTQVLLFNDHLTDFPLFSESIKYYRHHERFIRIAVQTITLNIFKQNEPLAIGFITDNKRFFATIGRHFATESSSFIEANGSAEETDRLRAEQLIEDLVDSLLYFDDIFSLNVIRISQALRLSLMDGCIFPIYLEKIANDEVGRPPALSLLVQIFANIKYSPLLLDIIASVFEDKPNRASAKLLINRSGMVSRTDSRAEGYREVFRSIFDPKIDEESRIMALGFLHIILSDDQLREGTIAAWGTRFDYGRRRSDASSISSSPDSRSSQAYLSVLIDTLLSSMKVDSLIDSRLLTAELTLDVLELISQRCQTLSTAQIGRLIDIHDQWTNRCKVFMGMMKVREAAAIVLYEFRQTARSMDKYVKSTAFVIRKQTVFPPTRHPTRPWNDLDEQTKSCMFHQSVAVFQLCTQYLKRFAMIRDADFLTEAREAFVDIEISEDNSESQDHIDLARKTVSPCTVKVEYDLKRTATTTLSAYLVLDDQHLFLVEPDPLRLGKGAVLKRIHLLDIETSNVQTEPNNSISCIIEEIKLEFVRQEDRCGESVVHQGDMRYTGGGCNVSSRVSIWQGRFFFPTATHYEKLRSHLSRHVVLLDQQHRVTLTERLFNSAYSS
ncbi:hypothetical protein BJ742DRAFT_248795 [Cladochytrium replicatum]|nr:hypothetical protein BJ742DRAFT_248795 [Cladochytrium replicatum]